MQRALPILAVLAGGCKAELPMQLAQDASTSFPCTIYADYLVSYNPAGTEGGSDLGAKTLGAPDGEVVSLAANSTLTVAFLGLGGIVDQDGNDILIDGTVAGELAAYVGSSPDDMVFAGSLSATTLTIDISTALLTSASYLRLVGLSGDASIDAFEAVQTTCTD